ncbi:MAG: hypothetical protein ACRDQF_09165, partial [Thermocrispum sp.]
MDSRTYAEEITRTQHEVLPGTLRGVWLAGSLAGSLAAELLAVVPPERVHWALERSLSWHAEHDRGRTNACLNACLRGCTRRPATGRRRRRRRTGHGNGWTTQVRSTPHWPPAATTSAPDVRVRGAVSSVRALGG